MLYVYRFRLYPKKEQVEFLNRQVGHYRFVYNKFLEIAKETYEREGKKWNYYEYKKLLPKLKKEFPFLKETNSQSLQEAVKWLDRAFKNFFKGLDKFSRFKNKKEVNSVLIHKRSQIEENGIEIPKLKASIKFKKHRERSMFGKLCSMVLKRLSSLIPGNCAIRKLPSIVLITFFLAFGCYGSVLSVEKDIEKYKEMCKVINDGKACYKVGNAFYLGKVGIVDYEIAFKYSKKSCELDYGAGCCVLGLMYKKGNGTEKDENKALELFKKALILSEQACKVNDADSCFIMGALYLSGWGTEKDYKKAVEFYKKACDLNSSLGCSDLGFMYFKGYGVGKGYKKAVEFYRKACELNEGIGCSNLGTMYYKGYGVEKDYKKAVEFYEKACELNEGQGCGYLGFMYLNGYGVEKDYEKAVKLFKKACELNIGRGCSGLGFMYFKGYGVKKDYKKAVEFSGKACELDDNYGCAWLGIMYERGHAVEKDYEKAVELYRKACKLNYDWGCYKLGLMYEKGDGVEKNPIKAFLYYKKGCSLGYNYACENLRELNYFESEIAKIYKPPAVEIIDAPDKTTDSTVSILVKIKDMGSGIGNVRIYLNDVLVTEQPPLEGLGDQIGRTVKRRKGFLSITKSFKLRIPAGENRIKIVAYDKDNLIRSVPATHTIVADLTRHTKPSFYAVVVGINKFENPDINLRYAVNDAKAVAQALTQIATRELFGNVEVVLLTRSEETTKENLIRVLKELQRKINPEDVFVFYIATHGEYDDTYYLLTSNVGSLNTDELRKTALTKDELKKLIVNMPATKRLIILDTCYSGRVVSELSMLGVRSIERTDIIKNLSKSIGTSIIASTTSGQKALEGYKKHGIFSYVLIKGLRGNADANGDGYLDVSEIGKYISSRVPEMASEIYGQKQYPVFNMIGESFYIGKVKTNL